MSFGPEAVDLLRAERSHLRADLEAIDTEHEPWIPQREVVKLRKRLETLDAMIAEHEGSAVKVSD